MSYFLSLNKYCLQTTKLNIHLSIKKTSTEQPAVNKKYVKKLSTILGLIPLRNTLRKRLLRHERVEFLTTPQPPHDII